MNTIFGSDVSHVTAEYCDVKRLGDLFDEQGGPESALVLEDNGNGYDYILAGERPEIHRLCHRILAAVDRDVPFRRDDRAISAEELRRIRQEIGAIAELLAPVAPDIRRRLEMVAANLEERHFQIAVLVTPARVPS